MVPGLRTPRVNSDFSCLYEQHFPAVGAYAVSVLRPQYSDATTPSIVPPVRCQTEQNVSTRMAANELCMRFSLSRQYARSSLSGLVVTGHLGRPGRRMVGSSGWTRSSATSPILPPPPRHRTSAQRLAHDTLADLFGPGR